MNVTRRSIAVSDRRGMIVDIVQDTACEHATFITSHAGAARGNHYHKETVQYVFVLSGRLQAFGQRPGIAPESAILEPFDLLRSDPMEGHALLALEYSTFLVLTHGPRGGTNYENDTFRLEEPLTP